MNISIDNWQGVFSNETITELTNSDVLLDYLNRLNGKNKTCVGLLVDNQTYMIIGGGNDGRYSVVGEKQGHIYNQINKDYVDKEGEIVIVTGGQAGSFELKYCLDKTLMMQAALFFYHYCDFDNSLAWEVL